MDAETHLAQTLLSESEAYGYTLTIWGAGAMLVFQFGTPTPLQIFLYVAGALVAFATLASVAFDAMLSEAETESGGRTMRVASMVHILATFGNLLVVHAVLLLLERVTTAIVAFPVVGFQATVVYNSLLLVEHFLPARLRDG